MTPSPIEIAIHLIPSQKIQRRSELAGRNSAIRHEQVEDFDGRWLKVQDPPKKLITFSLAREDCGLNGSSLLSILNVIHRC